MNGQKLAHEVIDAINLEISETVEDLIRDSKPIIKEAKNQITELANKSLCAIKQSEILIRTRGHDIVDHAADTIRHKPFKAMLIAATLGAITVGAVSLLTKQK